AKLISPFGLLGRCSSRNFRRRLREHYYEPAAQFTGESRDEDTIRITSFLQDFVIDFGPAESKENDSSQPINRTIDDIEKDEDNEQSTQILTPPPKVKSADMLSITWRILVKQFGDYWSLVNDWTPDQSATIALGSFTGLLVQTYFIHRAFRLSRNWYFLVMTSLFALSGPAASIVLAVLFSLPDGYDDAPYLIAGVAYNLFKLISTDQGGVCLAGIMTAGTFVADGMITGFTCWYLLKQGRISQFTGTKDLIARLVTVSMQSAVLPFACAVTNMVFTFRVLNDDSNWVNLFTMLMPYFYVQSLLFTLNSRSKLQIAGKNQSVRPSVYGSHSITHKSSGRLWPEQNENRTTEVYVTITSQSQGVRVSQNSLKT
ncbi:hypothetical protein FRC09_005880, partial [Ceratobasidium sp. 395]